MDTSPRDGMAPQLWAFLGSLVAVAMALILALLGESTWAALWLLAATGAGIAARLWSRRSPAPMPHWMRGALFIPRAFQSADRLKSILQPQPGQYILEIGPGVGIHALPIANALLPEGVLDVLDVQSEMLLDLMRRAKATGISNISPEVGDAQRLPFPDRSFDGAYLISVLGEVPDGRLALRELHRVLKPAERLVVGEIVADPDFVSTRTLREWATAASLAFERRLGPGVAYLAAFRKAEGS